MSEILRHSFHEKSELYQLLYNEILKTKC